MSARDSSQCSIFIINTICYSKHGKLSPKLWATVHCASRFKCVTVTLEIPWPWSLFVPDLKKNIYIYFLKALKAVGNRKQKYPHRVQQLRKCWVTTVSSFPVQMWGLAWPVWSALIIAFVLVMLLLRRNACHSPTHPHTVSLPCDFCFFSFCLKPQLGKSLPLHFTVVAVVS